MMMMMTDQFPKPKIKEEHDVCVDDDKKTPQEQVKEWDEAVCRLFARNCFLNEEEYIDRLLEVYKRHLNNTATNLGDVETLQKKILVHLKFIHFSYSQTLSSAKAKRIYLENMTDILTFYCHQELLLLKMLKKKPSNMNKREFKKQTILTSCKRITYAITVFLLGEDIYVTHLLMKLQICQSQLSKDVCSYLFHHFLVKNVPKDLSDESFCRYYILFCKWKDISQKEKQPFLDKMLYRMFQRPTNVIETNQFLRGILVPREQTSACSLMESSQLMCNAYFDYYESKIDVEPKIEECEKSLESLSQDDDIVKDSQHTKQLGNLMNEFRKEAKKLSPVSNNRQVKSSRSKKKKGKADNEVIEIDDDDDVEIVSVELPETVCIIDDLSYDDDDIELIYAVETKATQTKSSSEKYFSGPFLSSITVSSTQSKRKPRPAITHKDNRCIPHSSFLDDIDITPPIETLDSILESIDEMAISTGSNKNIMSFLDSVDVSSELTLLSQSENMDEDISALLDSLPQCSNPFSTSLRSASKNHMQEFAFQRHSISDIMCEDTLKDLHDTQLENVTKTVEVTNVDCCTTAGNSDEQNQCDNTVEVISTVSVDKQYHVVQTSEIETRKDLESSTERAFQEASNVTSVAKTSIGIQCVEIPTELTPMQTENDCNSSLACPHLQDQDVDTSSICSDNVNKVTVLNTFSQNCEESNTSNNVCSEQVANELETNVENIPPSVSNDLSQQTLTRDKSFDLDEAMNESVPEAFQLPDAIIEQVENNNQFMISSYCSISGDLEGVNILENSMQVSENTERLQIINEDQISETNNENVYLEILQTGDANEEDISCQVTSPNEIRENEKEATLIFNPESLQNDEDNVDDRNEIQIGYWIEKMSSAENAHAHNKNSDKISAESFFQIDQMPGAEFIQIETTSAVESNIHQKSAPGYTTIEEISSAEPQNDPANQVTTEYFISEEDIAPEIVVQKMPAEKDNNEISSFNQEEFDIDYVDNAHEISIGDTVLYDSNEFTDTSVSLEVANLADTTDKSGMQQELSKLAEQITLSPYKDVIQPNEIIDTGQENIPNDNDSVYKNEISVANNIYNTSPAVNKSNRKNKSDKNKPLNGLKTKNYFDKELRVKLESVDINMYNENKRESRTNLDKTKTGRVMYTSADKVKKATLQFSEFEDNFHKLQTNNEFEDLLNVSGPLTKINGDKSLEPNCYDSSLDIFKQTKPFPFKSCKLSTVQEAVYDRQHCVARGNCDANSINMNKNKDGLVGILKKPNDTERLNGHYSKGSVKKKNFGFNPTVIEHTIEHEEAYNNEYSDEEAVNKENPTDEAHNKENPNDEAHNKENPNDEADYKKKLNGHYRKGDLLTERKRKHAAFDPAVLEYNKIYPRKQMKKDIARTHTFSNYISDVVTLLSIDLAELRVSLASLRKYKVKANDKKLNGRPKVILDRDAVRVYQIRKSKKKKPDEPKRVRIDYDKTSNLVGSNDTVTYIEEGIEKQMPLVAPTNQNAKHSERVSGSYISYRSQGKLSVAKGTVGNVDLLQSDRSASSQKKRVYRKNTKTKGSIEKETVAKEKHAKRSSKIVNSEVEKLLKSGLYTNRPFRLELS